ncbi:hypothetical protein Ancab_010789 [Ancistrocladus abbreviatus]
MVAEDQLGCAVLQRGTMFTGKIKPVEEENFRSCLSIFADHCHLYIFGGCGVEGRLNDLWAYDVEDQKWIQFPTAGEICKGRGRPGLAVAQEKTLVWKKLMDNLSSGDHLGPRGWCAFAGYVLDGQLGLLVYGGNSSSNDCLDDIFFFAPC